MSQECVLVSCIRYANSEVYEPEIILIQKDRPSWQKGKLNLPGGKIEQGECPKEAAVREIREETGLEIHLLEKAGEIIGSSGVTIHCFSALVNYYADFNPREGETEIPIWMNIEQALLDNRLIPNLRVAIPLIKSRVRYWTIKDDSSSEGKSSHTFSITVPTYL